MLYFQPYEFECPDGTDLCMSQDFLGFLDLSRKTSGLSYKLTSAYRSPEHNEEIGGTSDSAHTKGMAVDVATTSSRVRYRVLVGMIVASLVRAGLVANGEACMNAIRNDVSRFGIGKNFIHADCDKTKDQEVIWLYN